MGQEGLQGQGAVAEFGGMWGLAGLRTGGDYTLEVDPR